MRVQFEGSTVLLTGASAGMGMAMARELAPRVARLILVARRTERLEGLRDELRAARPALVVVIESCDLSDVAATQALAARVTERFAVDILVNNAGIGSFGMYDRSSWEHTEREILRGFERGRALVVPGRAMQALLGLAGALPRPVLRVFWGAFAPGLRRKSLGPSAHAAAIASEVSHSG